MNVAVLFNAAEDEEIGTDASLAGKELYTYSLKTFFLCPCIDCIAVMRCESEDVIDAKEYIENWKTEYGIDKPVWVYQRGQNLKKVLGMFEKEEGTRVELYVLHDVRYPFVKANMIYKVVEKAALHGMAVTVEEVKDDLVVYQGKKMLGVEDIRYAKYPMAIQTGHRVLDELTGLAEVLEKCVGNGSYLCSLKDWNPLIGTWEDVEKVEAILRMV